MTKPNKKSVGSSYSYVDFDVDNNEQKLMACVTSEKLFCTRDKIHTETNTIVSIESSPPPEGVYFLGCYTTTMLRDHFSCNKRAKGNTNNHQNINNLRNYLQPIKNWYMKITKSILGLMMPTKSKKITTSYTMSSQGCYKYFLCL